jgi:hypothetical protein
MTDNTALKERSKEIKEWAKENLKNTIIHNNEFGRDVVITAKGIKEFINQPHEHWAKKNEILKDIQSVFSKSKYMGYSDYHKKNEMIQYSHIFEIEIEGNQSWIIVREDKVGVSSLYSISDSNKVLVGLNKK